MERLPLPTPGDLPHAGIKHPSLASPLSKIIIHIIYVIFESDPPKFCTIIITIIL